jgi:hypothetical protein
MEGFSIFRSTVFYNSLKERLGGLYDEVRKTKSQRKRRLKALVVQRLLQTIRDALEDARTKLSHKDAVTTVENYLNPRVIMAFLSQGGFEQSLEEVLARGGKLVVKFDVETFIENALSGEA